MRSEVQKSIPGWISTTLGERVFFEYGKSPNKVRDIKGKYPLIGSSGFSGKANKYNTSSPSIILGRKGTIDKPIYYETPCWAIDTTYFVDKFPYDESKYIFYLLNSQNLKSLNESTGVPSLSRNDLHSIKVNLPPLPEQKKIAEILSRIDILIKNIKLKIKKLEKLKISLINNLIQKGIKNYVFKDSELGKIPNSWDIVNFKDIFSKNTYGPRFNASNYAQDGNVKTIRGTDILENLKINYKQVPLAKLDEEIISNHSLNHGDIVMITTAECGFSAVFKQQNIPYICSAYAIRLEPNKKVNSNYCAYFLQSEIAKRQIQKFVRKGTVSNLPGSDVMKIRIPLPTIEEQNQIVSALEAIEELIKDSGSKLKVNLLLKNSLSQDLLSGHKRVNV
tara:strand:+ start:1338 stop:2513 length:1176 start_codon:yes stop_codon:yes gene_type:complete